MTPRPSTSLTSDELRTCCPPLPDGGLHADGKTLPLKAVRLHGTVTGVNAALTLTQTFTNPGPNPIEAVYTFPLPEHLAVVGLRARLGDRDIVGRIQERGAARADYADALATGHRAALVEQERGDVFTASVGNIAPGEDAAITLDLTGRLGVDSGEATLRVPLVVGERYVPGEPTQNPNGTGTGPDTPIVPDGSRITPPRLSGPTGVDLDVELRLRRAGLLTGAPRTVAGVQVSETDDGWLLRATPGTDLDRDLVARFGLLGDADRAVALVSADHDDPTQGTWQVVLTPSAEAAAQAPTRSVVLLLDRSGSMSGWKMVAARRAAARIIDSLAERDSFQVIGFDHDQVHAPGQTRLVSATDVNRYAAVRWLSGLEAAGGTEPAAPLTAAADQLISAPGERTLVLVTDGQVGNEAELMALLAARLQGIRVYALGIDHAVNATFLRRLAAAGGGRCDLVESEDELDRVLTTLHRRIAAPVAHGIAVAAQGVRIDRDATAPALADLFAAGPALVQGRWSSAEPADLDAVQFTVLGEHPDGGVLEWAAPATVVDDPVDGLRTTWARARLDALQDRYDSELAAPFTDIVDVSLAHQVLSRFTAWVAVGPAGVEGPLLQVVQPVAHTIEPRMVQATAYLGLASAPEAAPMTAPMARATSGPRPRPHESFLDVLPNWLRGRTSDRAALPRAGSVRHPSPAAPPAPQPEQPEQPRHTSSIEPFADRLRDLLDRGHGSTDDRRWARLLAELVDDLRSVDAPDDLVAAIADLPGSAHDVRRLWREHTGAALD